ncbi:MAG: hypothetical protein KME28_12160 [Pelatocladus maniniholoensis HA4357-MV3]|jgi:hypothetical protein|uniref:Uncharacterized protein n=1 Tax=Pelatocladus maniniholoensis HA4357-MV3 TaxID=1117104 RepID=A0A9E3H8B2_9NOST|nr:hypothetical protein [Pelatocladus maniniholoensis HA4357-MV3]BAZ66788.1 hypothetical protein NIES4106_15400 [Fischerella sp. NIES-4106]
MIPLILGAVAIGSAAFGALKGTEGVSNMNEASKIGKRAQKRHENAVSELKEYWEGTNKLAEEYGHFQLDVMMRTIGRFVYFIERNIGKAKQSEKEFLEGLDGISVQQMKEYKTAALEAEQFFKGGVKAVGAAAAGYGGAMGLATSVGVASTGTLIGSLSGAAAWNATLAWLGGGSLAAGGGGMALGTVVLGGITVGPALAIGGFVLASEGEKALTKAREYEAEVKIAIAKIDATKDFMQQVKRRITELRNLLESLNNFAVLGLNELESLPSFNKNRDASKFQQIGLLVKALAEIMKTPVLDSEGQLNPATATIQAKYRTLGGN